MFQQRHNKMFRSAQLLRCTSQLFLRRSQIFATDTNRGGFINSERFPIKRHISTTMSTAASSSNTTESNMNLNIVEKNRLAEENSVYLLQHAHNPVDWYPWGEEAFQKAKQENKPIFLSVGYSTCHWCHVMERESFENKDVASALNDSFISIKVDREERPDVDKIYMSYVQRTTGGGGWPMSVFLTPDLEPFYGGTYFPPEDKYGRVGFKTLLQLLAKHWTEKREILQKDAKKSVEALKNVTSKRLAPTSDKIPDKETWMKCFNQMSSSYDEECGGFSDHPKFPQPSNFNFLFHLYSRQKKSVEGKKALEYSLHTLKKMAYGGIHDHVSKGFARYSVDAQWHLPHFEKMLYDQSQLIISYLDAYTVTNDEFYADIARDIMEYVSTDLNHEEGGFYGAEDADSYPHHGADKKMEGAFRVWEFSEIKKLLNTSEFEIYSHHFNIKPTGNVQPHHDPHGELLNKNVISCLTSYESTAEHFQIPVERVKDILHGCNKKLKEARISHPRPTVDTKFVTAWNGLMIAALAKGGFTLNSAEYTDRATKCANFVKNYLSSADGSLLRCCYLGDNNKIVQGSQTAGFLDDYAFLIRGLLNLYEASMESSWLEWAENLQAQQNISFWDEKNGGYFTSPVNSPDIIIRDKEEQDGAEPCGNSVSVHNLLKLAAYLDRPDLRDMAGKTLITYSDHLTKIPIALPEMTSALMFYHSVPTQVFIAGQAEDNNTQALLDVLRKSFMPGRILAVADGPQGRAGLLYTRHASLSKLHPIHGKSAAYVCRNFACSLPVTEPQDLVKSLESDSKKADKNSAN